jgi:hypothetical protein
MSSSIGTYARRSEWVEFAEQFRGGLRPLPLNGSTSVPGAKPNVRFDAGERLPHSTLNSPSHGRPIEF